MNIGDIVKIDYGVLSGFKVTGIEHFGGVKHYALSPMTAKKAGDEYQWLDDYKPGFPCWCGAAIVDKWILV